MITTTVQLKLTCEEEGCNFKTIIEKIPDDDDDLDSALEDSIREAEGNGWTIDFESGYAWCPAHDENRSVDEDEDEDNRDHDPEDLDEDDDLVD